MRNPQEILPELAVRVAHQMLPGEAGRLAAETLRGMIAALLDTACHPAAARAFSHEFSRRTHELVAAGERLADILRQAGRPGGILAGPVMTGLPTEPCGAGAAAAPAWEGEGRPVGELTGWWPRVADESRALVANMTHLVRHSRELAAGLARVLPAEKDDPARPVDDCPDLGPMVHVLKKEIAMVGRSSRLAGGILGRLTPAPAVDPGPEASLEIGEPASPGAAPFGGTSAMVHAARLTAHQAALVDIRHHLDDFRQALQRFHEQVHRLEAGLRPGGSAEPGVAVFARDRLSVTASAMGTPAEGRHCLEELARFTECFARTPEPSSREELSGTPSHWWPPELHLVPPMPDALQQHAAFDAAQDFHDRADRVRMSRIKLVRLADPSGASAPDVTAAPVPAPAFLERLCGVLDSAETMNRVLGQRFHQFRF